MRIGDGDVSANAYIFIYMNMCMQDARRFVAVVVRCGRARVSTYATACVYGLCGRRVATRVYHKKSVCVQHVDAHAKNAVH